MNIFNTVFRFIKKCYFYFLSLAEIQTYFQSMKNLHFKFTISSFKLILIYVKSEIDKNVIKVFSKIYPQHSQNKNQVPKTQKLSSQWHLGKHLNDFSRMTKMTIHFCAHVSSKKNTFRFLFYFQLIRILKLHIFHFIYFFIPLRICENFFFIYPVYASIERSLFSLPLSFFAHKYTHINIYIYICTDAFEGINHNKSRKIKRVIFLFYVSGAVHFIFVPSRERSVCFI